MDIRKKAAFLVILYNLMVYKYLNSLNDKSDIFFYSDYRQDDYVPYARYNEKDIYIVKDEEYIIKENEAINVIDFRNDGDPDMKILDSYSINSLREMRSILLVLKQYNNDFPSNWNRSISSMEYEWILHNICYKLGYKSFSTKDVDLNNKDEGKIIPKSRN